MENIMQILDWMGKNEKLSGWAQATGTVIALVLAIAVPWWQRHNEMIENWRKTTEINSALAFAVYYLLADVAIYLNSQSARNNMPRSATRENLKTTDLLKRIQNLESRGNNKQLIEALFRARGCIFDTEKALTMALHEDAPLFSQELELLEKRKDDICHYKNMAEDHMRRAELEERKAHTNFLVRLFI